MVSMKFKNVLINGGREETPGDFPRTYIKFPMPLLPEEVDFFLRYVHHEWIKHPHSRLKELPICTIDAGEGGHGLDNPGLIFTESIGETRIEERFRYNVVARCSFGMVRQYEDKDVPLYIFDPDKFNRFHISIYANREFVADDDTKSDDRTVYKWKEEVNVSLRWVDGKFETGWNDKERIEAKYGGINEKRTTYLKSSSWGGISDDRGLTGVVRRSKVSDQKLIYGYEAVLGFLSRFGDISPQDTEAISNMSFMQGLDFLVDKVRPCAEKFASY
jgi:hypothetical protein